jgi:hypothetical protein
MGIYLSTDGNGGIVGGPPPIGVRIVATYDPNTNVIAFQMTEYGKTVGNGLLTYDPSRKSIVGDDGHELYRRFERISPAMRKVMGLEAKAD